ncbi:MAG: N-acetylmuramoyl-L-alanine amidase [Acidobacteriaceae bacterium]|nr:N-acetylmuramoyl-L-alanine amidase [Acidobacteriaceae bacterium]
MRWSSRFSIRFLPTLMLVIAVATALLFSALPEEKRLSVYSNVAHYSLGVTQTNNADYIGLLELLEPLGSVTARIAGDHWKFRYNDVECDFMPGKTRTRVRGSDMDLPAAFLLENSRGLISVSSIGMLLPRILGGAVTFNESARRLFIGNVAVHFTAQIAKAPSPKLVMNFTSPVNPMISTEPGKLRMIFSHDAVVAPGSPTLTFDSSAIPSASFVENNGSAEITVTSSGPVMASFSNDGRTISIAPPSTTSPQAQAQNQLTAPAQSVPPPISAPVLIASTNSPVPSQHAFALIDAAHGGDERGAALSDQLAEKDVTLSISRLLRSELISRGIVTNLIRDGDVGISLDQRAATANASGAAIYICLHATTQGDHLALYTALMQSAGVSRGIFLDWGTAQTRYTQMSLIAESGVASELRLKQLPVRSFAAPLRPLNNITTAAVAVEVTPLGGAVSQLAAADFQRSIAGAIAAGVTDVRDKLQGGPK